MDLESILESIAQRLSESRNEMLKVKTTEVYSEELIEGKREEEKDIPQRIKEMKAIAEKPETMFLSRQAMFQKQGLIMADYEDCYEEKPAFTRYYPTYRDMSDSQLRCYFTWRTKLKKGEYSQIDASYVFVYIYELLSLIGVQSAEEGFLKLRQLHKYIEHNSNQKDMILLYLDRWMFDFAVYYGLDENCITEIYDPSFDKALMILSDPQGKSCDEIFSALSSLSSYNVGRSKFFAEYGEDFKRAAVGVYRDMSEYFRKNRKNSYFEWLFGKEDIMPYRIFDGAVFRAEDKKGYEYKVSEVHSYKVSFTGAWFVKRYPDSKRKNKGVGKLLKSVDRIMREEYGFSSSLAKEEITKQLSTVIYENIYFLKEEKKQKERNEIKIDTDLLLAIRKSADSTRDKLIVEEIEEEEETIYANAEKEAEGLAKEERELICCLLGGGAYTGKTPVSILCDSINEKLFDSFSDTVIDFEGDSPYIIDDYKEELEELIK